jgi:eukaryotic-like serine/threonine-protein kinase
MSDTEPSFGRYEPLFEIAQGGMARVYAARATGEGGFSRALAIKHMLSGLDDPSFTEMFLDEARLAAAIHSPHVVHTFDVGRASDGRPFLAMELVIGVSLGRILFELARREEKLPLPIAVAMLRDAALGLHHAHEACDESGKPLGIVHRDVSPQNVLVDEHGRVRITDFGIARALERRSVTRDGATRGKPGYMSPEQAAGRTVDRRSDVYSLGVVAWETIAGGAFDAAAPNVAELRADVPAVLGSVIARALSREPGRRQKSAIELANALESGVRPASAREIGAFVRELCGAELEKLRRLEATERVAPSLATPPRARKRSPFLAAIGVLAGTVLVAGALFSSAPPSRAKHALARPIETPSPEVVAETPIEAGAVEVAETPAIERVAPAVSTAVGMVERRPRPRETEAAEPEAAEPPPPSGLPFGLTDFPRGSNP